jgi:hypothetical protein
MKPFAALKFCMPVLGLGTVLLLAPQARAQSEINPDHFDGTDSWAAAPAVKAPAPKATKPVAASALQAKNKKSGAQASAQLTPVKGASGAPRPELVAAQEKRKTPPAKPNKQ